jgi:hypothetical protein
VLFRSVLDCCVRGVLCGEVCWTAVCVAFCVERCAGLQCARSSVWRGVLDCCVRGVLCGEVCWTAVCVAFYSVYLIHKYIWIQPVPSSNPGYFDFNFRGFHQITIVIPSTCHFLFGIQLIIFCYVYLIIFSFCFALSKL